MSIRKQTIISCDVDGCDAELILDKGSENLCERWIVMHDYSVLREDVRSKICICPLHNIRLKNPNEVCAK